MLEFCSDKPKTFDGAIFTKKTVYSHDNMTWRDVPDSLAIFMFLIYNVRTVFMYK